MDKQAMNDFFLLNAYMDNKISFTEKNCRNAQKSKRYQRFIMK